MPGEGEGAGGAEDCCGFAEGKDAVLMKELRISKMTGNVTR